MSSRRIKPEVDVPWAVPPRAVVAWQDDNVRAPAALPPRAPDEESRVRFIEHIAEPHPPPAISAQRPSSTEWAACADPYKLLKASEGSDTQRRWRALPFPALGSRPAAPHAAAAGRDGSQTASSPAAVGGGTRGARTAGASRHGARARGQHAVVPWHVRLWNKVTDARDSDNAGGWLLRRGLPMLSAALFVFDVASDAVLARDLLRNGYHKLGTMVLAFMLSHYVPTYLMVLRATNQSFYLQRKMLPTATAKATAGMEPAAGGGTGPSAAPVVAGMAAVLESLHFFFYVLLVLFGLPLLPVMDAYMVLTAVLLPVDTGEAGYAMRAADDFCRQYERIRLPLECFMESLPQTGLQVYLYMLTRAGTAAQSVQVSQVVLLTSLLGSVLNLTNVAWELYNSYRASGSTPGEYLMALISLQGYTKVPIEVQKALISRAEEHQGRMQDLDRATGASPPSSATTSTGITGERATDDLSALADKLAGAIVISDNDDGGGGSSAGAVQHLQAAQRSALAQMLRLLRRGALPPDLVFRVGGPEDSVYGALSSFQRRILMDLLAAKVRLDGLRAVQLLQLEPVVAARLLRNTPALPGLLRLEGDWKPRGRHGAAGLMQLQSSSAAVQQAVGGAGGGSSGGASATGAGAEASSTSRNVSYLTVVTQHLPDAARQVDLTSPLVDLQLSCLPLTLGSGGSAVSLNPHSPYLTGSAAVGRGLAQVMVAQPHLDWVLVDRCDVHAPTMLEAMDAEVTVLTRSKQPAAPTKLGTLARLSTLRIGRGESMVAVGSATGGGRGGSALGASSGAGGGRRRRVLVVVHPVGSMELETWLVQRAQKAGGAAGGTPAGAPPSAGAAPAFGAMAPSLRLSQGAAPVPVASLVSELHLVPDYVPTGEMSTGAQVVLAPYPRAPGLRDALVPLLSSVLAPKALDLNAAAFSDLRGTDAAAIAACLVVNNSVDTLQMRSTGLVAESLKLLLPGLQGHRRLQVLDLSLNDLSDAGVADLAAAICRLPRLNSIMLAKVGMGAAGADALAGHLLACETHTQLRELVLLDNRDECGTWALEWLCFLFQQRTGKAAKQRPATCLEGWPAIPTFGMRSEEQQACLGVMRGDSGSLQLLPHGAAALPDMRHVVMVAAAAALAPWPVALAATGAPGAFSSKPRGSRPLEEPMEGLPGFNHPGGTAALLGAVLGGLLGLSPKNLHEMDLSYSIGLASPDPSAPSDGDGSYADPDGADLGAADQAAPTVATNATLLSPPTTPVQHLSLGLSCNSTLCALRLVGSRLDDGGVIALCGALCRGGCPALVRLELHHNPGVRDRGLLHGVLPLLRYAVAGRRKAPAGHVAAPDAGSGAEADLPLAAAPLTVTFGPGCEGDSASASEAGWTVAASTVSALAAAAVSGWGAEGGSSASGSRPVEVHLQVVNGNARLNKLLASLHAAAPADAPSIALPAADGAEAAEQPCADNQSDSDTASLALKLENDSQALTLALALLQQQYQQQQRPGPGSGVSFTTLDLSGSRLGSGGGQAAICAVLQHCLGFKGLSNLRLKGVVDSAGDELLIGLADAVRSLPCLWELDVQGGGGGTGSSAGSVGGGFVASAAAAETLLRALCGTRVAPAGDDGATACLPGSVVETVSESSRRNSADGDAQQAGGQRRRVLRLGPVQPSVVLLRRLQVMCGLAGVEKGDAASAASSALGSRHGPTWDCMLTSGKQETDSLCAALLARAAAPGALARVEQHSSGGQEPALPVTPADTAERESTDQPAAVAGAQQLPVAPGVKPASMAPQETMALAWAICQQAAAPAGARPDSTCEDGEQQRQAGQQRVSGMITALLLIGGVSTSDAGQLLAAPEVSAPAAAVLEACRLCCRRLLGEQALLPAAAPPARLAATRVLVDAPGLLTESDAAALALALVPGDLGREHELDFTGCKLSPKGLDALLQLLPLHSRTLRVLNLGLQHGAARSTRLQQERLCQLVLPGLAAGAGGGTGADVVRASSPGTTDVEPFQLPPPRKSSVLAWPEPAIPAGAAGRDAVPTAATIGSGTPDQANAATPAAAARPKRPQPARLWTLPPAGPFLRQLDVSGWGLPAPALAQALKAHSALRRVVLDGREEALSLLGTGVLPRAPLFLRQHLRDDLVRRNAKSADETALIKASKENDLETARRLLANPALNPNVNAENGRTPLHLAAYNGHLEVVKELLLAGAGYEVVDEDADTPLHDACAQGHTRVAEALIWAGADLDAHGHSGRTPMHKAAISGHMEVIRMLLEAGANPNLNAKDGENPLYAAVLKGHMDIIEALLHAGADFTSRSSTNYNRQVLHVAVVDRKPEVVDMLLKYGADPNARGEYQRTPLHMAAIEGSQWMVESLLRAGANPDITEEDGETPLYIAVRKRFMEVVEALLQVGADLSARSTSNYQRKVLHVATVDGNADMVDVLLQHGVDPNERAEYNRTAVHMAAIDGLTRVVEALLRAGAEVNVADENLRTPLHMACYNGHLETVEVLLRAGADHRPADKEGDRPLHDAAAKGHVAVVEALLRAGADPDARGRDADSSEGADASEEGGAKGEADGAGRAGGAGSAAASSESGEQGQGGDAPETEKPSEDAEANHRTPLCKAAIDGFAEVMEVLLRAGADPNVTAESRRTPLHMASYNGHLEAVEVLLRAGADTAARDEDGDNPMHYASAKGYTEIVAAFIKAGADVNARGNNGRTCLHKASIDGYVRVVEALLQAGADPNLKAELDRTALLMAAFNGHMETVEALLRAGADLTIADADLDTPLHCACSKGYTPMVEALLRAGADLHTLRKNNRTALHMAAYDGHPEVVELLLRAGAELSVHDVDGDTPLHDACSRGHVKVVEALLAAGADTTAKERNGRAPLHKAAIDGHSEVVELLIKAGVDVNMLGESGRVTLHYAAYVGNTDVVEMLLAAGANVSAADEEGDTPLHYACTRGHADVVEALLRVGADVNAKGKKQRSPLHMACLSGHVGVVEVLLQAGADTAARDATDRTAEEVAALAGEEEVVEFLRNWGNGDRE